MGNFGLVCKMQMGADGLGLEFQFMTLKLSELVRYRLKVGLPVSRSGLEFDPNLRYRDTRRSIELG